MKIRMRFNKVGTLKFIGHLDVMRYYQKAFRRARVDMVYSKGYSPHPLLSFAQPLGVGLTSEGEYLDLQVHSTKSSEEMIAAINAVMTPEMQIMSYKLMPDDSKTAMASISAAEYLVYKKDDQSFFESYKDAFLKYMDQNEILIEKETKHDKESLDIRPYIYDAKITSCGIRMFVSAGSKMNIRPEFILESFAKFAGFEYNIFEYQMHRIDLYTGEGEYVSLGDEGEAVYTAITEQK